MGFFEPFIQSDFFIYLAGPFCLGVVVVYGLVCAGFENCQKKEQNRF